MLYRLCEYSQIHRYWVIYQRDIALVLQYLKPEATEYTYDGGCSYAQ